MNKFTDIEYSEIKPKIYYTIPQIAEIIGDDEKRTRYWGETYGEQVKVEIIDGRRKYSEESIDRFKTIKVLIDEHNFSKSQIIKYFSDMESKRGSKYSDFSNATDLINPDNDPLGMEVLAAALTVKMEDKIDSKLNDFLEKLIVYQENYKTELIAQIKTEIATDILDDLKSNTDSIMNKISNSANEIIDGFNDNNKKILSDIQNNVKETIKEQQDEFIDKLDKKEDEANKRLLEIDNNLKKSMEEQRTLFDEMQNSNKKGFFSRFLGK